MSDSRSPGAEPKPPNENLWPRWNARVKLTGPASADLRGATGLLPRSSDHEAQMLQQPGAPLQIWKAFHNGRFGSVFPLTFGRARLSIGPDKISIDDSW